jgi:hypothetical protein
MFDFPGFVNLSSTQSIQSKIPAIMFRSQDLFLAAMFLVDRAFGLNSLHLGDPTPKDAGNRGLRAKLVRSSGDVLAAGLR